MSVVTMTGDDTLSINGRVLDDLADNDAIQLSFPESLAEIKVGKSGNSLYALNENGRKADVTIRVMRGSSDDKFLNGLLSQMKASFADFVLMTGEFIKREGNGEGEVQNDTYVCSGGIFSKQTEGKSNTEGDTEQSVAIYNLQFAKAARAIT